MKYEGRKTMDMDIKSKHTELEIELARLLLDASAGIRYLWMHIDTNAEMPEISRVKATFTKINEALHEYFNSDKFNPAHVTNRKMLAKRPERWWAMPWW